MQKNVAAQILSEAKDAVGGVRIADVQAQEEIALGVEPVEIVKTLGDLLVTKSPLRTEDTR